MATLDNKPIKEFYWTKQGIPTIEKLPNGIMLMMIQDDTDQTFNLKEYQRFGDIVSSEFTAKNYGYMQDIFTYSINKLFVYRIDVGSEIDQEVQDDILGLTFDYGIYPEAEALDYTVIKSMVEYGRSQFLTIKWVMSKQATDPDKPYFIQIDLINGADSEGNTITVQDFLPTFAAQRTAKPLTQSLTYDICGKLASFTQSADIDADLAKGIIVPFKKNGEIVYVRDINSLVTMSDKYDQRFRENQRFLVMDTINRDILHTWDTQYVGNFQNSGDNKRSFISVINTYISKRADDPTDPVQKGLFYIDWEEHRNILRDLEWTEDQINSLDISDLEDIDTGTFVYVSGQAQINGVMEDVRFVVALSRTVVTPQELL